MCLTVIRIERISNNMIIFGIILIQLSLNIEKVDFIDLLLILNLLAVWIAQRTQNTMRSRSIVRVLSANLNLKMKVFRRESTLVLKSLSSNRGSSKKTLIKFEK